MGVEIDKKAALVDAFSDCLFQNQLREFRNKIEEELQPVITLLAEGERKQRGGAALGRRINRSLESRVKSPESFEEKIARKDYIHKWKVAGSPRELQEEICKNLPDLIGLRITCLFQKDEEIIYSKLYEAIPSVGSPEGENSKILLNPKGSDGTKQDNGHLIYKMTGIYKTDILDYPVVSFEIQIKSIIHTVWGEVEHKTIYKGIQYDINPKHKKTMTEQIYQVLSASDIQLQSLFENTHDQSDLIKALFFEQTRVSVEKKSGSSFLAKYYYGFFNLFWDSQNGIIKQYVASHIIDQPGGNMFHPILIEDHPFFTLPEKQSAKTIVTALISYLEESFDSYYISMLKDILEMLYIVDPEDGITKAIACSVYKSIWADGPDDDYEEDSDEYNDTFGDDPDTPGDDRKKQDFAKDIELAKKILRNKIKDACKDSSENDEENNGKEGE